jgi:hypothetical protein
MYADCLLQVKDRQKDTLAKLQAFTQKLRTSTKKEPQQQHRQAAEAAKAADLAAQQQRQQEEQDRQEAAAAASKQEAANGSSDKAAGATGEAYDGKVSTLCFDAYHDMRTKTTKRALSAASGVFCCMLGPCDFGRSTFKMAPPMC